MPRTRVGIAAFVLMALAGVTLLSATDEDLVSGEWVVQTADDDGSLTKTIFDFYLDGGRMKGSVLTYPGYEYPIEDGKISGNKISFTLKQTSGNRTLSTFYVGKVTADAIEFEITPLTARGIRKKVTARRVKQGTQ